MNHGQPWTLTDEIFLMENYKKIDREKLAEMLGRKPLTITKRYSRMEKQGLINEKIIRETRAREREEKKEKNRIKARIRYHEVVKKEIRPKYDDDEFIEKAYQRVLKEKRDYGIGKEISKMKFKLGQSYIVKPRLTKGTEIFKGKLMQETKDLVVLKGIRIESFLKKDFLIGEYEIKEVRS